MGDLLLALLLGLAIAAVRSRDLLGAVAALGVYSLMIAILWCWMNALDVAFTEAAVGAGISTVLMLAAVARVGRYERKEQPHREGSLPAGLQGFGAVLVVVVAAVALLYGARDMPQVGDPYAPANAHPKVAKHYLEASEHEVGPPNTVTSVLADYRGYDTLGETVVIFTAGLCVVLLLRFAPRRRSDEESPS